MKSIKHAIEGILYAIKTEKNFSIMMVCSFLVVLVNIVLSVSRLDWIITLLCSGLVLGLELINTSIERTLDLYSDKYDLNIKVIKDMVAGGVLIVSLVSFTIGVLVYLPYVL